MRRKQQSIAPVLVTSHFPPAEPCPRCGLQAAYRINGLLWCVAGGCDPGGRTYVALDRWFRSRPAVEIDSDVA